MPERMSVDDDQWGRLELGIGLTALPNTQFPIPNSGYRWSVVG